jgi:diguanylate cyclase (GGDEF)-like protein
MRVLLYGPKSSTWLPLERALAARGHETAAAFDIPSLRRMLTQDRFPLLILREPALPLCRELRALPETEQSFLLAATGSSDPEELLALVQAGADDLLFSQPEELLDLRLDITERRLNRSEESEGALRFRLLHEALYDELTGLPNRALFMDRLDQAMQASRESGKVIAILFLDVDHFKTINDGFGYPAGDQLLVEIARSLISALRSTDLIARVGGNAFGVLLEAGCGIDEAEIVAKRIHDRLIRPLHFDGHKVCVTASIGIVGQTSEYARAEELLRDADTAMCRAKTAGRACQVVFQNGMRHSVAKQVKLESDLRRALSRGELQVAYQPFVALESGKIVGFEALLRWFHPRLGLLMPDKFLTVAEETGLIVPIGRFIFSEACRRIRELQCRYPDRPLLKLTVNLSHRQFFQPDLLELVAGALQESGLPAFSLGLEITEGVMISHTESALHRFNELKMLGVQLYLDDFGKGYSGFNHLHRFPTDVLKIDSSFVQRIDQEPHHGAIVEAIVQLSHQLGMQVVAEGIEEPRQAARLLALGCEYGQGFLYSPAVDGHEAESLVDRAFAGPAPETCSLPVLQPESWASRQSPTVFSH